MLRTLVLSLLMFASVSNVGLAAEPKLQRIKMATVTSSDLDSFEARYDKWLNYKVRHRGTVSQALADSWGAPGVADRPFLLMSADGAKDVFIRVVEAPVVEGHVPMTTWGWNSIEIIVDDPVKLRGQFDESPFKVIGEPKALGSYPSIVAFQVQGPDQEVLYLTAETGDRDKSTLPLPNGDVGRPFIMVLAGPDIDAMLDWYSNSFDMTHGGARKTTIGVVQRAQGLQPGETVGIGLMRMPERGNLIEFDGYSPAKSGPRPFFGGDLPPGISMTSFNVESLDALDLPFIQAPQAIEDAGYGGKRAATLRGAAGELVELIER